MILCIESWKGDIFLSGKSVPAGVIKHQMRTVESLRDPQEDNFIPLLCRMYGWETEPYTEEIVPDLTYDRDTGLLF